MAYTPTKLYAGTPGTSSTTLYTASNKVIIKEIVLCNTSASAATITLYVAGVYFVSVLPIEGRQTLVFSLNTVLNSSEAITALQATASAITAIISGVVIS